MAFSIKKKITLNLLNIPGWRTKRKLVVFESDDWGSVRMSSKDSFHRLRSGGVQVDQCPYNTNDGLESNEDLEKLFNVLNSVKDSYSNPAVITANTIVANPDFDKIRDSEFEQYCYEPFTQTLKRYPRHNRVFQLYQQGINSKVFIPQLHGREHVNVDRWMDVLKKGWPETRLAFDEGVFGISKSITKENRKNFMPALDFDSEAARLSKAAIVKDGIRIFKDLFGYASKSFIAPAYTWNPDVELAVRGEVLYFQGITFQKQPVIGKAKYRKVYHYTGQTNAEGQIYLVRNAFFEPSLVPGKNWVEECLGRISIAFKWGKPAIIGTHRLNYIGYIREENREKNLMLLSALLKEIVKRWPAVEFTTSDQLGDTIRLTN